MKVKSAEELISENLIVRHLAGSHAYGTATEDSDVDIRGIFHADAINLLTPFYPIREVIVKDEEDTKYYELAHFFKLCLDCNPNIIETLWIDRASVLQTSPVYEILREHRKDFLSSKIKHTTSGYVYAQLKRIKGHNKWINNPQPIKPPNIGNYFKMVRGVGQLSFYNKGLLEFIRKELIVSSKGFEAVHVGGGTVFALVPSNESFVYKDNQILRSKNTELGSSFILCVFDKEGFALDKENHKNYWYWKNNRNVSRNLLEEDYGFDCKHGMHLVRLFRMGLEALETGEIKILRPDAEELLEIRNGKWTYEQILDYAEECDSKMNKLYMTTDLPKKSNLKKVADLLLSVQRDLGVY